MLERLKGDTDSERNADRHVLIKTLLSRKKCIQKNNETQQTGTLHGRSTNVVNITNAPLHKTLSWPISETRQFKRRCACANYQIH